MSTLKHSMGWNETRRYSIGGINSQAEVRLSTTCTPTALRHTSTATLRNLWLVKWGQRAAATDELLAALVEPGGFTEIFEELVDRALLEYVEVIEPVWREQKEYCVLKKEDHADY